MFGICLQHVLVGSHSNSKDMRTALMTSLTNRQQFGLEGVDWDSLVMVASIAEETRSGVDELVFVLDKILPPDADNFQVGHSVALTPNRSSEVKDGSYVG